MILGENIFLAANYLRAVFHNREGRQTGNTRHFVKENKCVAQM